MRDSVRKQPRDRLITLWQLEEIERQQSIEWMSLLFDTLLCISLYSALSLYTLSIHSTEYTLYSYVKGIENGLFYVLWQWSEAESKALQFYVILPSLGRECSLKFHIEIQLPECIRPFQRYEYPHTTLTLAPAHINTHTHIHMQYANFAKQNASTWQRERGSLGLGLGL